MRIRTREVARGIRCDDTCGYTRVDVFVSAVARVEMSVNAVALHVCEQTMLDSTTKEMWRATRQWVPRYFSLNSYNLSEEW